jgi:hypothetical protein
MQKFEVRRTLGTSYFVALQLGWLLYQAWAAVSGHSRDTADLHGQTKASCFGLHVQLLS